MSNEAGRPQGASTKIGKRLADLLSGLSRRLRLVALSLLAVLILFEVAENIRYALWKRQMGGGWWMQNIIRESEIPKLLWEYRPNAAAKGWTANSHGYRDGPFSVNGNSGPPRVALLGDSVAFGLLVDNEEVIDKQLERELDLEVLNLGIPGYNAEQVAALMEHRAADMAPDAVVYLLCLNDFDFEDASGQKRRYFTHPGLFFLDHLKRARRAASGLEFHEWWYEETGEEVLGLIEGMARLAEGRDIPFLVAMAPTFPSWKPRFADYPLGELHNRVLLAFRDRKIPVIDLLKAIPPDTVPKDISHDAWHPNADGVALLTKGLVEPIRALMDSPRPCTKEEDCYAIRESITSVEWKRWKVPVKAEPNEQSELTTRFHFNLGIKPSFDPCTVLDIQLGERAPIRVAAGQESHHSLLEATFQRVPTRTAVAARVSTSPHCGRRVSRGITIESLTLVRAEAPTIQTLTLGSPQIRYDGLWEPERTPDKDDPRVFAWTKERAVFDIVGLLPHEKVGLRLGVLDMGPLKWVGVGVQDQSPTPHTLSGEGLADLADTTADAEGRISITIKSKTWDPPGKVDAELADPRKLGVAVWGVQVVRPVQQAPQ